MVFRVLDEEGLFLDRKSLKIKWVKVGIACVVGAKRGSEGEGEKQ